MFGDTRGIEPRIPGFEHFELLGWGGFGAVYRAHQPTLNRDVAVKVLITAGLDERLRRRFDREQKAMGSLSTHPAIVTLHEAGYTEQGLPYLAMELMEGGSIAARLAASGPLHWREAIDLIIPIAGAVEAAHRAGVLHRDIKPANILISRFGEAKLADFGIAALTQGTATATRSITATVEHAPPEVLGGDPPTAMSDVYSLGSTLFTLLAGQSPFRRGPDESVLVVMTRIATETVPDLRRRGVPNPVCAAVERSLAKDPEARPQSAAEFASLLEDARREAGAAAVAAPASPPEAERIATAEAVQAEADSAASAGGAEVLAAHEPPSTAPEPQAVLAEAAAAQGLAADTPETAEAAAGALRPADSPPTAVEPAAAPLAEATPPETTTPQASGELAEEPAITRAKPAKPRTAAAKAPKPRAPRAARPKPVKAVATEDASPADSQPAAEPEPIAVPTPEPAVGPEPIAAPEPRASAPPEPRPAAEAALELQPTVAAEPGPVAALEPELPVVEPLSPAASSLTPVLLPAVEPEPETSGDSDIEMTAEPVATATRGACGRCGADIAADVTLCPSCLAAAAVEPQPQAQVMVGTATRVIPARRAPEPAPVIVPAEEKRRRRLPRVRWGSVALVLLISAAGVSAAYFVGIVALSLFRRELGQEVTITWVRDTTTTTTAAVVAPLLEPVVVVVPIRGPRDDAFHIVVMQAQPGQQLTVRVFEPLGDLHTEVAAVADDSGKARIDWVWSPGDPFGPYQVRAAYLPDPTQPGVLDNAIGYLTVEPAADLSVMVDPPEASSGTSFLIRVSGANPVGEVRLRVLDPSNRMHTDVELAADSRGVRVFGWRWAFPDLHGVYTATVTDQATGDTASATFTVIRTLSLEVSPTLGDHNTVFRIVVTGATPRGTVTIQIFAPDGAKAVDRPFLSQEQIVYGWFRSDRSQGQYTVTATDSETGESVTRTFTIGF